MGFRGFERGDTPSPNTDKFIYRVVGYEVLTLHIRYYKNNEGQNKIWLFLKKDLFRIKNENNLLLNYLTIMFFSAKIKGKIRGKNDTRR